VRARVPIMIIEAGSCRKTLMRQVIKISLKET
jgi:hypothetical protein